MAQSKILFRPLEEKDSDRLFAWRNSDDVRVYMYNDQLIPRFVHDTWFAGALTDSWRHYFVIVSNDIPVGLANFYDIRPSARSCSWAYYLGDPSTRGQGIGACVEYMMIERAFGDMALNKLWCEVLVSNEAVWKLHHSFGFVTEAHFRQHIIRGDGAHDVYGLGLLTGDWTERRLACRDRLIAKGFDLPE